MLSFAKVPFMSTFKCNYWASVNLKLIPPLVVEEEYWFDTKGFVRILSKNRRKVTFSFI